jgi:hypothetical protein
MSDLPNPPQSPNTQTRREHDTSKAKPERSLVALQQCLGALLIFVLGLVSDVRSNDSDETQADGFADLEYRLATLGISSMNLQRGYVPETQC